MTIKNIYVPELSVINEVLKYLSVNNINYLFIKDSLELHFDNYILKFFMKDDMLKLISESNKQEQKHYRNLYKEDIKRIKPINLQESNITRTIKNSELILKRNLNYRRNSVRKK